MATTTGTGAVNRMKTMTSFSGADLVVTFGSKVIGELQQISWAVQREKAPVYTLGSADPRSFSRGKRGIAGSLVFAVFDRDALMIEMTGDSATNKGAWNDIAPKAMFTAAGNLVNRYSSEFEAAVSLTNWDAAGTAAAAGTGSPVNGTAGTVNIPQGFSLISNSNIVYNDMLPPLDITMTFANEYGQAAFKKIYDMDFLNEGSGVSVDSIVMEQQMTWIARRMSPVISGVYDGASLYKGKDVVTS